MPEKPVLLDVPVEVLFLAADPPLIVPGRVTCRDEDSCDVLLASEEHGFSEGMQVIVDAGEATDLRVVGNIAFVQDNLLHVESHTVVPRDKRIFPRTWGGIRLRYQVAEGRHVRPWIDHGEPPSTAWHEPDPFMDFSGSGLKFEDLERCAADDTLLLELSIPPSESWYRASARVVRLLPIPPEEQAMIDREEGQPLPTHQVAVQFLELPPEAVEALMDFTLRVQDALI
ncbi:MAG: PilZ domain-containing protein [Pseudomonadota bacterium]